MPCLDTEKLLVCAKRIVYVPESLVRVGEVQQDPRGNFWQLLRTLQRLARDAALRCTDSSP